MRDGDLRESPTARASSAAAELVLRKSVAVQQHDRDAVEAGRARGLEIARAASPYRAARALGLARRRARRRRSTRAYSISGSTMSSAKMSGRCWPPMRMASSSPAVMTSTVGSPRRSSSAFVATVVPILTAAMAARRRAQRPAAARCRRRLRPRSGSGSTDKSFSVLSSPAGVRATTSVNVPPRSIQNSQPRFMRLESCAVLEPHDGEITERGHST